MPSDWPYGDIKMGSPLETESDDGGATLQQWAHFTGINTVTEVGGRAHPALGGGAALGYHLATIGDHYAGVNSGRWFSIFTPFDNQNGSSITQGAFHASERRLIGGFNVANGDTFPDLVTMHNTVFACDGKGRWIAGQAPPGWVYSDDGGVFTDESTDASSRAADDVLIFPSAAAAVNDALYIGAAAEFEGFWMDVTTALTLGSGGTTITAALEYYNGSSWAAVIVDNNGLGADVDLPGTTTYAAAQQYRAVWTRATNLSDWATTTVNGQSAYWVRIRISAGASGSGYVAPKARSIFLIEDNAQKTPLLPACYEVGEDPGTTAPSIKGWGLHRLDANGTEQISVSATAGGSLPSGNANVYYTWYDSTRDIETEPVGLGNYAFNATNKTLTLVIGDHPDPNVDKVRIYLSGTSSTIAGEPKYEGDPGSIGIGLKRLLGEFALTNTAGTINALAGDGTADSMGTNNLVVDSWKTIDLRRVGDGPYLASTIPNGIDLQPDVAAANGYYKTCCIHKGRIYCAGTDVAGYQHRVVWSVANNPHCFPKDNYVDVPMSDGELIVAIRSAGQVAVVLGTRSVWAISSDPESSNVSVSKIADVGCLSKKSAITVGQRCFFLGGAGIYAVGSGGTVELITPQLTRLFRDLWETTDVKPGSSVPYQRVVHTACAGYDPSREFVLFAIPGLIQQISGGAGTNQDFPDACLQINLVTGRSSIWVFDIPPSSFATVPMGNNGMELWYGTPLGRLRRLTNDTADSNTTAAISGTVAGTHSATTLQDTTLALTASTADSSFVGQMLYKTSSTGANPEGRMITKNTTDTFTVNNDFTNTPVDGDLYYIGQYWMSVESGDLTADDPGQQHRLTSARLHLEDGMNSSNALSLLSTDELRSATTTWNAGGSLSASTPVEQLSLAESQNFTQRFRILARMGAARFRLFAVAVMRTVGLRPRG